MLLVSVSIGVTTGLFYSPTIWESCNEWKKMYEDITYEGGGGNAWIDNIRTGIKNIGTFVDEWTTGESGYREVPLDAGLYAVMDDNLSGVGGVAFFEVNETGQWRKAPEFIWDENYPGEEIYKWTEAGEWYSIPEGFKTESEILLKTIKASAYAQSYVVIQDQNGKNLIGESQVEIYRKTDGGLEKVYSDKISMGELFSGYDYDDLKYSDAIILDVLYPGTYVIKCVSVPAGYEKFADITFTITRNVSTDKGHPVFNIAETNGNVVRLTGPFSDDDYFYGAQETVPAVIEITLKRSSAAGIASGGNTAGNTVSSQSVTSPSGTQVAATSKTASGQVTAAKTGERNYTAVYLAAAGAAVATGVAAFALKKKREKKL